MASKQGELNGAFYGPAIPPRRQTYRSVGRSSDCGCCLLCTLFKFILYIVITVGIAVLVLWLIFRPNKIKVYVDDAQLSQFNLTNNNTINFNLAANMSIRNPNKRIGIYYDSIEAMAYYDGSRFGYTALEPFYQGHKTTTVVHPVFKGQQLLHDSAPTTYNREKGEGNFFIDVDLKTKLRLKVWIFKIRHIKPKIDCTFKLPVPARDGVAAAAKFEGTKCRVKFI